MKPILCFLAALSLHSTLQAQEIDPNRFGTLSFYFENDLFARTDENYTNGTRISWTSPALRKFGDDATIGGMAGYFDNFGWTGNSDFERNVAISLGQSMFTPRDVDAFNLVDDERPYAGWLYVGMGIIWKNHKVKNTLALNIGVVGPWSYAEETQRLVHEARNQSFPNGWDNQIGNEIGVNASYERMWRIRDRKDFHGWDWDILPYAGATLGNVMTHATLGTELRFGYNLPDDFGTGAITEAATTPTAIENPYTAKSWARRFGFHFFIRGEGRAVARNIFLDGNTFRDSHSVDKYPLVGDLSAGIGMNWKNTKLSYAYIYRTKEFRGQDNAQIFGSVTLSFNF
ncbi:lipid A deacylase LpxR family protein [Prosthecobacter sp. SYSU 5D2]|uniref:lipid A deacylase LpxR family protein n=1 Tax=Prosthecobacter sp. SYSU 5D2 TaxID=3134134 RepID=UPI0031FF42CC